MSLILISTLIIGMILGAVLHGTYMRYHFRKNIARWRTSEGFVKRFEKVIQPADHQKDEVEKILNKTFENMRKKLRPRFQKFESIMDSMKLELEPFLTLEQKKRLNEYLEHMKNYSKDRHRRHNQPIERNEREKEGEPD